MSLRQNRSAAMDPLVGLADPSTVFRNPDQLSFVRVLVDAVRRMGSEFIARDRATPHLMLTSPNGTVYKVTVADNGTITTTNARAP